MPGNDNQESDMNDTNDMRYVVTGVDIAGRRFRKVYTLPQWAFGINLWRGSVWEEQPSGKRRLLRRVWN